MKLFSHSLTIFSVREEVAVHLWHIITVKRLCLINLYLHERSAPMKSICYIIFYTAHDPIQRTSGLENRWMNGLYTEKKVCLTATINFTLFHSALHPAE